MVSQGIDIGHMDILHLINHGSNTATKISDKLKISRTTIRRRIKDLLDNHYIIKVIAANTRIFELTTAGNEAVAIRPDTPDSARDSKGEALKVHKVTWSAAISRKPWKLGDDLKEHSFLPSTHKNWTKFSREYMEEDMTIVFNPNRVFFYIREFFISNPIEYYDTAKEKVMKACKDLEAKFPGLVLGDPKKLFTVHSQHVVKVGGPLAAKFEENAIKTGNPQVFHGKNLDIDHSQGDWEEETKDNKEAPIHMEVLGQWFDDMLEAPIMPNEIRLLAPAIKELAEKQNVEYQASVKATEDIKEEHRAESTIIKNKLSDLTELQASSTKQIHEDQLVLNKGLFKLYGSHKENVKVMDKFAVAMHEHLVLVQALQGTTLNLDKGFKLQRELSMKQVRMFENQITQQNHVMQKQIEQQNTAMINVLEMVKELKKPWYVKLAESVKKWRFNRKKDKINKQAM